MRLIALTTLLALVAGACGGGSKPNASQAAAAVPGTANAAAAPAAPATEAVVVEVKMTGNGTTKAAFEPDALTMGMPNPMGDLTGPFLTQPNEKYDVSFAGAPAGVYKGY